MPDMEGLLHIQHISHIGHWHMYGPRTSLMMTRIIMCYNHDILSLIVIMER
jgi:hypothetical protein